MTAEGGYRLRACFASLSVARNRKAFQEIYFYTVMFCLKYKIKFQQVEFNAMSFHRLNASVDRRSCFKYILLLVHEMTVGNKPLQAMKAHIYVLMMHGK